MSGNTTVEVPVSPLSVTVLPLTLPLFTVPFTRKFGTVFVERETEVHAPIEGMTLTVPLLAVTDPEVVHIFMTPKLALVEITG